MSDHATGAAMDRREFLKMSLGVSAGAALPVVGLVDKAARRTAAQDLKLANVQEFTPFARPLPHRRRPACSYASSTQPQGTGARRRGAWCGMGLGKPPQLPDELTSRTLDAEAFHRERGVHGMTDARGELRVRPTSSARGAAAARRQASWSGALRLLLEHA